MIKHIKTYLKKKQIWESVDQFGEWVGTVREQFCDSVFIVWEHDWNSFWAVYKPLKGLLGGLTNEITLAI